MFRVKHDSSEQRRVPAGVGEGRGARCVCGNPNSDSVLTESGVETLCREKRRRTLKTRLMAVHMCQIVVFPRPGGTGC
ncbi:hypothetical protein PBY51_023104 [Eleginops maclovinus]|uniref:Uncharacterized protein n=1 Tax=Eleginops maclovinus TaxID=56733 RepID=A0AAN7WZ79_ELEMC|nr:hypothetical protein PBY51_023104 [Eleginops maclovinus]